jgi:hypothetical protein
MPELLETRTEGGTALLRLRYEYAGELDPIGRRLLGGHRLSWLQELRIDRAGFTGSLVMRADAGRQLHGSADFSFLEDGNGSVRRLEGSLEVRIIGVGPMAERRIVPGVLRRLDIEAAAVAERVEAGR